ncbi:hypothetical protein [Mitsuaria sp. GD03876]|uniref:golvesin C-terminal-like domain-containing protein n=1 Tax=Mitsuaria sp. GD03876 TaxID=2975399 RepID=UPI00244C7C4F|nr:hypothetical protein [Mitsuaria sp. GD03876]MDH0867259.1 hypothetical protein [Mitsuaria sp. GD03876]
MNRTFKRRLPLVLPWLVAASAAAAQTTVVDNTSTGFTANYVWTSSTAGSATFAGPNHLVANGLANILDNTSPQFSTTGNWQARTDGIGMYGPSFVAMTAPSARFPYHFPPRILDNDTYHGAEGGSNNWLGSTALAGYYGANYRYFDPATSTGDRVTKFRFVTESIGGISQMRTVQLSAHWPASPGNASNAIYRVRNGAAVVAEHRVNQRQSSGDWAPLGQPFSIGSASDLTIEVDATGADGVVIADAVRLVSVDATLVNAARWQLPSMPWSMPVDIYARWPQAYPLPSPYVAWTLVGGTGHEHNVIGNPDTAQAPADGEWRKLGRIDLQGTQSNYVLLEETGVGAQPVFADAVAYVPANAFPIASWESSAPGRAVDLYVQWSADATRSAEARYVVTHWASQNGACVSPRRFSVKVDQRDATLAAGTYLGRVPADQNCGTTKVELVPGSGVGTLSADAVRFVSL